MKVILLQDIRGVGQKFDVKTMANGHAAHLLRTGALEMATKAKLAKLENKQKAHKIILDQKGDDLDGAIAKIKKEGISIMAKANDDGGLFEGVTVLKLQEAIADSIVELPINAIVLDEPIKEVGEYEVELKSGKSITKVALVIAAQE